MTFESTQMSSACPVVALMATASSASIDPDPRRLAHTTMLPGFQAALPRTMRRLLPDAALLHQRHLLVDDFALVVGVLAWDFVEVAVLWIDRLLVDDLREFGAHVLEPVGHLRGFAVMAQRLDVDDAGDEGRAVGVALLADELAAIVDDHRLAAAGIDAEMPGFGIKVIAADVRRHDVHVVLERTRPVGNLEHVVLGERARHRGAIDDLGAVHGE